MLGRVGKNYFKIFTIFGGALHFFMKCFLISLKRFIKFLKNIQALGEVAKKNFWNLNVLGETLKSLIKNSSLLNKDLSIKIYGRRTRNILYKYRWLWRLLEFIFLEIFGSVEAFWKMLWHFLEKILNILGKV